MPHSSKSAKTMAPVPSRVRDPESSGRPQKRLRRGSEKNVDVTTLPVNAHAEEIYNALESHDVTLLIGETGSGKTTQLPQQLLWHNPEAYVVITQPRRMAAISVATRVATERGGAVGDEVGYAVRFDDCSGPHTQIRYVTDGVLLREALSSGLSAYTHVVVDEVHERSVNTDIVLGVVKRALHAARAAGEPLPFKLVVMSATTDAEKLSTFFSMGAPSIALTVRVVNVPGRLFAIDTFQTSNSIHDFVDGSVTAAIQVHFDYALPGDVLVFLPGQDEILAAVSLLKERMARYLRESKRRLMHIHALFASLPPADQMRAIEPLDDALRSNVRKVIFSTNIAETSITIPGIKYVIDSGVAKTRATLSSKTLHADVLRVTPISKAQAKQRAGRAGRVEAGAAFRLYTQSVYDELDDFPKPEILRVDTASSLLQVAALGASAGEMSADTLQSFPFVDRPPKRSMQRGLETLIQLGALDDKMALTETGRLMASLPAAPKLARALLESVRIGCVDAMVSAAAMLSVEGGVFLSPPAKRDTARAAQRRFVSPKGDTVALVNALESFVGTEGKEKRVQFCKEHFLNFRSLASAMHIRQQLRDILAKNDVTRWAASFGKSGEEAARWHATAEEVAEAGREELLLRCLVAGFFTNTARRKDDGKYALVGESGVGDTVVEIHPASVLRGNRGKGAKVVLFDELVITSKPYLRNVVSVKVEWLWQHSNGFFSKNIID